jgi:hypothetical protein
MAKVTDETLMFYADGVLASPERENVAKLLAEDSDLCSRLQIFQRTGGELAELLQDHVEGPVPDRLYECLQQREHRQPGLAGRHMMLRQLPTFAIEKLRSARIWHPQLAVAAVLALIAGVGLGWVLRGDTAGSAIALDRLIQLRGNKLIAQGQLQRTLESTPSRKTSASAASDNEQLEVNPRMTFRNSAGNYCRQYEVTASAINRYVGVACRSEDEWQVEMQAITPPANSGADRFVPATGGASLAMDVAIGALVFGPPLNNEEEATVIRERWKNAN